MKQEQSTSSTSEPKETGPTPAPIETTVTVEAPPVLQPPLTEPEPPPPPTESLPTLTLITKGYVEPNRSEVGRSVFSFSIGDIRIGITNDGNSIIGCGPSGNWNVAEDGIPVLPKAITEAQKTSLKETAETFAAAFKSIIKALQ